MSRFFATCQTETNTSNVVVVCRFILVDIHQFSSRVCVFTVLSVSVQCTENGPAYIQDFKDY